MSDKNLHNSSTKLVGIGTLASLLPPLFLEARVSGSVSATGLGNQIVTQLGLSMPAAKNLDVAIFSRTSGAAFAVGIGSFMAYKLLYKLIRSNCLWTALEQISPEVEQKQQWTTEAETSLTGETNNKTIELTEGFYAVRLGGENELLRQLDECLSDKTDKPQNSQHQKISIVQVRQANALRQLFRRNRHIQRAGIASLDQCSSGDNEFLAELPTHQNVLCRSGSPRKRSIARRWDQQQWDADGDDDDQSILSNMTSASRIPPNPRHSEDTPSTTILPEIFPPINPFQQQKQLFHCTGIPSTSSSNSLTCSDDTEVCSTSLQLQFDNELSWENEFSSSNYVEFDEKGSGLFLFREREDSLGGLSQLSAMKNLERMFNTNWHNDQTMGSDVEEANDFNVEKQERELLMESALEGLRGMEKLDSNTTCTSSILNSIRHRSQIGNQQHTERRQNNEEDKNSSTKLQQDEEFPFTAYRIVLQNELDVSEASSAFAYSSSQSAKKKQTTPRHNANNSRLGASQGLWELTSRNADKNSRVCEKSCHHCGDCNCEKKSSRNIKGKTEQLGQSNLMVDSVISSHSSQASTSAISTKHSVPQQQTIGMEPTVMYDSAIVTDFQSNLADDNVYCLKAKPEEKLAQTLLAQTTDCLNIMTMMSNTKKQEAVQWVARHQSGIVSRYRGCDLSQISEHSTPLRRKHAKNCDEHSSCDCNAVECHQSLSGQPSISGQSLEWFGEE